MRDILAAIAARRGAAGGYHSPQVQFVFTQDRVTDKTVAVRRDLVTLVSIPAGGGVVARKRIPRTRSSKRRRSSR